MAIPSVLKRHPRWRFALAFLGAPVFLTIMYHWLVPDLNWLQTQGLFARPGIGFSIWTLLLVLTTWAVLQLSGRIRNPWRHLLLIPYVVIAADIALFESRVTAVLGTISLLCIYILWLMLVTQKPREQRPWLITPAEFLESVGSPILVWWGHWVGWKRLSETRKDGNKKTILWIVIGVAAAVPAVIFFATLLSSADPFIIAWLESITWEVIVDWIPRIIGRLAIAFTLAGLTGYVLRQSKRFSPSLKEGSNLPSTILTVFMGILSGLFLLFLSIQARALFGGEAFLQTYGLTYSEYAREGFFQLWVAAAIALILSIVAYRLMKSREKSTPLSIMLIIYNALTLLMSISSLYRLHVYISTYDLTVLRMWATGGVILVILALAGMLVVNAWKKPWWTFTTYAAYLALAWIAVMLSINVESRVAFHNLQEQEEVLIDRYNAVDMEYINSLSTDAAPALLHYSELQAQYCEEAYTKAAEQLMEDEYLPHNGHKALNSDNESRFNPLPIEDSLYYSGGHYIPSGSLYSEYNERKDGDTIANLEYDYTSSSQYYEDPDHLFERTFPHVVVGCSYQDALGVNNTEHRPWQRTTLSYTRATHELETLAPNIETHKEQWYNTMRAWQEEMIYNESLRPTCDEDEYYDRYSDTCRYSYSY